MQDRKQLWREWRCRGCGAKASRNIVRIYEQWRDGISLVCRPAYLHNYDLIYLSQVEMPPALTRMYMQTAKLAPGIYCRKCATYLTNDAKDFWQILSGLLTRDEALALFTKESK